MSAVWFMSGISKDVSSIKDDLSKIEQRQEKLYWYSRAVNERLSER